MRFSYKKGNQIFVVSDQTSFVVFQAKFVEVRKANNKATKFASSEEAGNFWNKIKKPKDTHKWGCLRPIVPG